MKQMLIICVFSWAWFTLSSVTYAKASAESTTLTHETAQPPQLHQAALALPLEDILQALSKRIGVSFIFDSRIIRGKHALPLDEKLAPEEALRQRLTKENLFLHKVNSTTYAITKAHVTTPVAATSITSSAATRPTIDTIVVIASTLTARTDTGSRNLFVIDQEALENFSTINPSEAIYDLPQALASISAANSSFLGASAGLNLADIRGFGPQQTLVLFNGRRQTLVPGGNEAVVGFDLNSVATPFLQRIEISSQFSGARLGPEAAAGAINFVTKNDIEGIEAGIETGISQRGDAEEVSVHVLGGTRFLDDKGRLNAGINHTRENGLFGADREITSSVFGFTPAELPDDTPEFLPGLGGSSITPNGLIEGVLTSDGSFISVFDRQFPRVLTGNNELEEFTGRPDQFFNFNAPTQIISPINRTLGFLDASIDLTAAIRLFADVQSGVSETNSEISPLPIVRAQGVDPLIGNAFSVNISDPTVPNSIRQSILNEFGEDTQTIVISRRLSEFGPRLNLNERRYNNAVFGVQIEPREDTQFTVHYRYGRNSLFSQTGFRLNRDALLLALDTPTCAVTSGCTSINLFETGGFPPGAVSNIRELGPERKVRLTEHEFSARYSTKLSNVLNNTSVSAGILVQRSKADSFVQNEDIEFLSSFTDTNFSESLTSAEFDIGLQAPILTQKSVLGFLDLNTHYRAVISSEFETAHNVETDLQWRPLDGLIFSGGIGIGRRTPNVTEAFFIGRTRSGFFLDPCTLEDPAIAENCASNTPLGVAPGFQQTTMVLPQTTFGNPELELEKSRNWRAGIILEPHRLWPAFPGNLTLSATWIDHRVQNYVTNPGPILVDCFSSENFSSRSCGANPQTGEPLIARDPVTQQLITADTFLRNDGSLEWRGLDLEAQYIFRPRNWPVADRIWVSGIHTYIDRTIRTRDNGDIINNTGNAAFPNHRSLLSMGISNGPFDLSALANRRGRAQTSTLSITEAQLPIVTTFDVAARYSLNERTKASFRIENVTDKEPPLVAFSGGPNTLPQHYDIFGRRFSIGLKTTF